MPPWNDLLQEIINRRQAIGTPALGVVRRERMQRLATHTGRPLIIYAVDFLNQSDKARATGRDIQSLLQKAM